MLLLHRSYLFYDRVLEHLYSSTSRATSLQSLPQPAAPPGTPPATETGPD